MRIIAATTGARLLSRSGWRATAVTTAFALILLATATIGSGPVDAAPRRPGPIDAATARPGSPREAATERAALASASATDQRVEVTSLRSETTQVFAEPDGTLTAESAAVPQRVRRANGEWAPVDLALKRSTDGTLRPGASIADVRFSDGGTDPLVTVIRDGKTMTLSWPAELPAPTVRGDLATYPNVLPDVDLVVRATDLGFAHVLVVKTPRAAADPQVRQARYRIGGDVRVVQEPGGGGLQAVAGRTVVASAQQPVMWDSTVRPPAVPQLAAADTPTSPPSTPTSPGQTATIASVTASVSGDSLTLRPDLTLLNAPAAAFPLYVDPPWSAGKNKWAYATNNNSNNTDTSVARVGKDPEGSRTYRSFFTFNTAFLNDRYVHDARVEMELDHSASCTETWTHMYRTGAIASTPRTKWIAKMPNWVAAAASRAPEGAGCDGKADQVVSFKNAALTTAMHDIAGKSAGAVTFGFCACNADGDLESSSGRWKKFFPNKAKLIIDYASYPGKPTGLRIAGTGCPATGTVSIGTLQPTFTATYPDDDVTRSQILTASYELVRVEVNGNLGTMTPPGTRSVPAASTTTSGALAGVVKGTTYRIRTRATDPKPYNISGPWSPWCTFTVDTAAPGAPTITVITPPTGPGAEVKVRLTSTAADVVQFTYGWDDLPVTRVAAAATSPKSATVSLTAARYGDLKLYARAIDGTGNSSIPQSETFVDVDRPSKAIAQWRLEGYPSSSVTSALDDANPTVGGNTPLTWESTAPDTGWRPDARLLGATTASFDRTPGGDGGAARAQVPALDTSTSFSAAAWARVTDSTTFQTVVSKEGADMSVFRLQYRPSQQSWCMTMRARDVTGSVGTYACAPASSFKVGTWTHLAGVYDDTEARIRLYIDGALAADEPLPPDFVAQWAGGWNASGPVVVGRGLDATFTPKFVDFLHGEVADVQLFDRALVNQDLVGQRADDPHSNGFDEPGILAPPRVGTWNFVNASSCYAVGEPDSCAAQDATEWDRPLSLTAGAQISDGIVGNGIALDGTHFAEEGDPLHGTATHEYGFSQHDSASTGTTPVLQDASVLRTDQPFTVAAWVRLDDITTNQTVVAQDTAGSGYSGFDLSFRTADRRWVFAMRNGPAVTDSAQRSVVTATADDPTAWHHLVAVFDPGRRQLRLYVDGAKDPAAGAVATHAGLAPWQATGPLVVGRSDQPTGFTDWLSGSVDNVSAWQGVLTDAAVSQLYARESLDAVNQSAADY